jgi:hypothetical protein
MSPDCPKVVLLRPGVLLFRRVALLSGIKLRPSPTAPPQMLWQQHKGCPACGKSYTCASVTRRSGACAFDPLWPSQLSTISGRPSAGVIPTALEVVRVQILRWGVCPMRILQGHCLNDWSRWVGHLGFYDSASMQRSGLL